MIKSEEKYMNFPIQFLSGFLINDSEILTKILHYSIYKHSLKMDFGNDIEKIIQSAKNFSAVLKSAEQVLNNGKIIHNSIPSNSPIVGLSVAMFWDFYLNEKTEFEKVSLLGFLAIKSILGNKTYCKITNAYLWARMDGKTSAKVEVDELSNELRKYANRYQTENIKNELIINWHLIYFSHYTRGFYVSFKISLEALVYEVAKKKKKILINQQKELKKEALKKAFERLKKEPP